MSKGPEEQESMHYSARNLWGLEYRVLGSGVGEKFIRNKSKRGIKAMHIFTKRLEFII